MRTIISLRLKKDRRGVSNIIVVVLSLLVITVIASNVVLWSYQMNQLDWEKMREDVKIIDVARATSSPWFVTQREYAINMGSRTRGTYEDTQTANDDRWETYLESPPPVRLDLNGIFIVDLSTYPLISIQTIEIQLRYRASDSGEKWYLKAYNWATRGYSDDGFNSTTGHQPTTGWDYYAVNLTNQWSSYVRDDGLMYVKLHDERADSPQDRTTVDIDFLGVRATVKGTSFTFKNEGPLTSHLVSLWIIDSTNHLRYDIDVFINSAETLSYSRADIRLPDGQYTAKVVTERGNIAVYLGA